MLCGGISPNDKADKKVGSKSRIAATAVSLKRLPLGFFIFAGTREIERNTQAKLGSKRSETMIFDWKKNLGFWIRGGWWRELLISREKFRLFWGPIYLLRRSDRERWG